jgi:hypothetical protein
MTMAKPILLALGDCNTCGTEGMESLAYPVPLARELGADLVNCGHTMSTVREGWEYAQRRLTSDTTFLTIQYGLVDSWLTFRGAPYVLYYPDNFWRRLLRKGVKKYKKIGRKLRFHQRFGEAHFVPPAEYRKTLIRIIRLARERSPGIRICLISTPPSREVHRLPGIEKFNVVLREVAQEQQCAFVDAYAPFAGQLDMLQDHIHLKPEAHAVVARLCAETLRTPPAVPRLLP